MFNNPYMQQQNLDRINDQIKQLENIRNQMQQPAPITQNFQLAPSTSIRYAKSIEEVDKSPVMGDTPFFSQDMTVLWLKNTLGEVKTYELKEIIKKDEKDLKIESYMDGMRGSYRNYEETRNEYNRGNYGAKEDGLKELEYMMHAAMKFIKMVKEEATSPEEQEIVRKHIIKISEYV